MKKIILLSIFVVLSSVAGFARWSVGADARIAPSGEMSESYGTDIVVNYQFPIHSFFIMPSVGLFYQSFTEKGVWISGGNGENLKNEGYRTGIDFTCVIGKPFNLGAGKVNVFTGPRYAYAFASNPEFEDFDPYLQNSFDWRVGLSYSIWKITASAKVDFAFLRLYKKHDSDVYVDYVEKQPTTFAFGLAYNF